LNRFLSILPANADQADPTEESVAPPKLPWSQRRQEFMKTEFKDRVRQLERRSDRASSDAADRPASTPLDWRRKLQAHTLSLQQHVKTDPAKTIEIFQGLLAQGVHLNVTSYTIALNAYAAMKQPDKMLALFQDMHQRRMTITVVAVGSLIHGLVSCNRLDIAIEMFDKLAPTVVMNEVVYGSIIDALVGKKRVVEAARYFQRLLSDGLHPTSLTKSVILFALLRQRDLDTVYLLLDQLASKKDFVTPNILRHFIFGLCRASRFEETLAFLPRLKPDFGAQLELDDADGLLEQALLHRNAEFGTRLMALYPSIGVTPDGSSYATLLRVYQYGSATQSVVDLLKQLEQDIVPPSSVLYYQMAQAYAQLEQPERLKDLLSRMEQQLQQGHADYYGGMCFVHCQLGHVADALQALRKWRESGVKPPGKYHYRHVLELVLNTHDVTAMRQLEDLYREDCGLDPVAFSILLTMYQKCEDFASFKRVADELEAKHLKQLRACGKTTLTRLLVCFVRSQRWVLLGALPDHPFMLQLYQQNFGSSKLHFDMVRSVLTGTSASSTDWSSDTNTKKGKRAQASSELQRALRSVLDL